MSSYSDKLKDPRWQKKRACVLQRDQFRCRDCDNAEKTLHVHHCYYKRGGPWETSDSLLLTLCEDCHAKRQSTEDRIKHRMGAIFARMSAESLCSFDDFLDNQVINLKQGRFFTKEELKNYKPTFVIVD